MGPVGELDKYANMCGVRGHLLVAGAAFVLVLSGCSDAAGPGPVEDRPAQAGPSAVAGDEAAFLAAHDLAGKSGEAIVDHLDRVPVAERPTDLMASVRGDHLVLADEEQEVTLDLPEDQYYLSIAPYVDQTHECYYHSLTTCLGELGDEGVGVRITDDAGEVIVDEQTTTFDNGFVGFWVPQGVEGTVEVTYGSLTGQTDFSATEESATCLTTLRLG